jgi:flagellum-specific peptidoglycan hydrolase FlgJ
MIYKYSDEKLTFEKVNLKKVAYVAAGVAAAITLALTLTSRYSHQNGFEAGAEYALEHMPVEEKMMVITQAKDSSFSQAKLVQMLKDLNVRFPHIVMAQAIIESGHFQSNIFRTNHNLFGMKQARMRCTTAKGTNLAHAYYDNWKESVYDYAFFQSRYLHDLKTEAQYLEYLDRNYAEAKNYDAAIKRVIENEGLLEMFD